MGGGNNKTATELTAQYSVRISGSSTCTVTNLKTGESKSIGHDTAATSPLIFGNMKITYNNSGGYYWIITDINGLYLAYRTSSSSTITYTARWQNSYTNTGTFYFCDSIPVFMTIPS